MISYLILMSLIQGVAKYRVLQCFGQKLYGLKGGTYDDVIGLTLNSRLKIA